MTMMCLASWPPYQCHIWSLSHEMGLKSNSEVVGCSHDICATFAQDCLADYYRSQRL